MHYYQIGENNSRKGIIYWRAQSCVYRSAGQLGWNIMFSSPFTWETEYLFFHNKVIQEMELQKVEKGRIAPGQSKKCKHLDRDKEKKQDEYDSAVSRANRVCFEPLFGSLFLYSPFLLRMLPLGWHSSTPSFLASSKSLRCYGFKKQKSPLESIRKVAVLVCECAELFCSKIRKSICLLSQGNKQLYMPSKISNETSCIELISSFFHLQGRSWNQDRQYFSRLSQLFHKRKRRRRRRELLWSDLYMK